MPVKGVTRKHLKAASNVHSYVARSGDCLMPATNSRFFDELAKLMGNAAGAAQGIRKEIDTLVQAQVERVLNNLNVVKREEFEVVKDMVEKARLENIRLESRLSQLEKKLDSK